MKLNEIIIRVSADQKKSKSKDISVGTEGRPLKDGPLWYEDDFELKAIETLHGQEKFLPLH